MVSHEEIKNWEKCWSGEVEGEDFFQILEDYGVKS